ncbi:MAG: hypothetical protein ACYS67_12350 [Planctomycetota bacterium]
MSSSTQNKRSGIVLLVTLVLLVVLSVLMFNMSTLMSAQRHRDKYIIDYQSARYARDSAVKYALATLSDMNTPILIERPNEPDFSDLFMLDDQQYEEFLAAWAEFDEERLLSENERDVDRESDSPDFSDLDPNDVNSLEDINSTDYFDSFGDSNEPNAFGVRGPYGPPWPFITKPVEIEIGTAKVRIEIEDENAKYPIGWAMMDDKKIKREAVAGLETFCEWMDFNDVQIDSLKDQLKEVSEIKTFKVEFKNKSQITRVPTTTPTTSSSSSRTSRSRVRPPRMRTVRKTITAAEQIAQQSSDFSKLCHSSLIDRELLARPIIISETRQESALKYMGMWATRKVNINTAPRHVLETAFIYGGDADQIAEEIIQRRRIKPFADIEELRRELFRYSVAIEKCEKYITTASSVFTIKVTATVGVAEATAVIGITKEGQKARRIAVISG